MRKSRRTRYLPRGHWRGHADVARRASKRAKERLKFEAKCDEIAFQIWEEAIAQLSKGCLEGPFPFTVSGKLPVNGATLIGNPAYRFGAQQADKLRVVGNSKRSPANTESSAFPN